MIKSEVAQAILNRELLRLKQEGHDKLAEGTGQTTRRATQGIDGKTYEVEQYVSETPTPGWLLVFLGIGGRIAMRGYKVVVGPNGEFVQIE